MTISVNSNSDGKVINIQVADQFDYSLYQAFRDAYCNAKIQGTKFIVDLSRANYMDSSAVGMILLLKEHAEQYSGVVVISKPNDSVHKILMIANFQQLVTIEC